MLGVIDYGSGNFKSVCNALKFLKLPHKPIKKGSDFELVTHIILPGVGTYKDCMQRLERTGILKQLIVEVKEHNKFFLGICVGHQILSTLGTEFEASSGLDLISGKTVKLNPSTLLPVPHIGWAEVFQERDSQLFNNIENGSTFYFVHSYHFEVDDSAFLLASYNYSQKVTAAVNFNHIYGVQFHPEKSQSNGLQLLKNFSSLS